MSPNVASPDLAGVAMILDASPDTYIGSLGDDVFYFVGDKDSVFAGAGIDSIKLNNNFAEFSFSGLDTTSGSLTMTYIGNDNGTSIRLVSVERFVFADRTFTFDQIKATLPQPLIFQFSSTASSANEGNSGSTTVTVQATLSAASTQTVTVPIT